MVDYFGYPRSITLPSLYTGLSASGNTGKIGHYEELRRLAFLIGSDIPASIQSSKRGSDRVTAFKTEWRRRHQKIQLLKREDKINQAVRDRPEPSVSHGRTKLEVKKLFPTSGRGRNISLAIPLYRSGLIINNPASRMTQNQKAATQLAGIQRVTRR